MCSDEHGKDFSENCASFALESTPAGEKSYIYAVGMWKRFHAEGQSYYISMNSHQ